MTGYYGTWQDTGTTAANNYWHAWTAAGITITHTATTTVTGEVWDDWNEINRTATTSAQTYPIWDSWAAPGTMLHTNRQKYGRRITPPTFAPETPKQRAARERDRQIRIRRREVADMRQRVAARRAERLLMENLDDEQRADWIRDEAFDVKVPSGRTYRIRRGVAGNVYRTHDRLGRFTRRRYCCHVDTSQVPVCDNVLTQKLLLEANEDEFLRLANVA